MYTIFRLIYSLLLALALPFIVIRMLYRARRYSAHASRWPERFGIGLANSLESADYWLHAVSVGEVTAALPVIKQIQHNYPAAKIIVSTTTAAGAKRLQAAKLGVRHVFLPYDLPIFLRPALQAASPKAFIILETELWPNLLNCCKQLQIPTLLVNARISDNSWPRYKLVKPFIKIMLSQLSRVLAQSQLDATRLQTLGLAAHKVEITPNLKFDQQLQNLESVKQSIYNLEGRTAVIAASTHAGEELAILQIWPEIIAKFPETLLIIVPRHPDRFKEVESLIAEHGFSYIKQSQDTVLDSNTQVLLGDTVGQLVALYEVAELAFVGGSLVPIGGHNLLEPAALQRAILTGPYLSNFRDIAKKLQLADALCIVHDPCALQSQLLSMLANVGQTKAMGQRARQVLDSNRGGVRAVVNAVTEFWTPKGQPSLVIAKN